MLSASPAPVSRVAISPGDAVLVIHNGNGTHVIVEHFVNCVGDSSLKPHRRDFAVAKFQYAHENLLRPRGEAGAQETGLTHYARGKIVVKKNAQNFAWELLSPKHLAVFHDELNVLEKLDVS